MPRTVGEVLVRPPCRPVISEGKKEGEIYQQAENYDAGGLSE
jgi:hypothetical protein